MRQVAELAGIFPGAELWVQHSDRLARGDGKLARHVVELALWANRAEVSICSLQDPDTFRDLLYAVVTGQRNHLDSQRKGATVEAGLRRTVARGAYAGICVDGYRRVVEVGPGNTVIKRLEIDPERAPLIELVFRLALDGSTPWEIARAVTAAGWQTVRRRGRYEAWGILRILNNPRYAGLSPWKGEILGPADWPAYITPEQFATLRVREKRRPRISIGPQPLRPYLLVSVARCGHCHSTMRAVTGKPRQDGTQRRSYKCSGHSYKHCDARPLDAAAVDWSLVAHLEQLLTTDVAATVAVTDRQAQLKHRITSALSEDNLGAAAALLDELRRGTTHGQAEPPAGDESWRTGLLLRFQAWIASVFDHPDAISQSETRQLRTLLGRLFERLEMSPVDGGFQIEALRRGAVDPSIIHSNYAQLRLDQAVAGYPRSHATWTRREIILAIQAWAHAHGESPVCTDWPCATAEHPVYTTVFNVFGTWRNALNAAGLKPRPRRPGLTRERDDRGRYIPVMR